MKSKLGLSCLIFLCLVASSFRSVTWATLTEWVTCSVDDQFSVQLPVPPTELDMMKVFASQGITPSAEQVPLLKSMKLFTATDGVVNYMVTRTASGTETSLYEPGVRATYYEGAVNGLLQKEQGTLLQRSVFRVNGAEGVELSYKGVHKATGKRVIKHNRMLAVGRVMYLLAVYPVDKNDSTGVTWQAQRTKFFNSLAFTPSPQSSK